MSVHVDTKRCPSCGETKPTSEFFFRDKAHTRLSGYCKACHLSRSAAYKRANPEWVVETNMRWNRRNPEALARARARFIERHKYDENFIEKTRARRRRHYLEVEKPARRAKAQECAPQNANNCSQN